VTYGHRQGDEREKVGIFGGDNICHFSKKKNSYEHVSTSEWLELFEFPELTPLLFFFVRFDEQRSSHNQGRFARRINPSNFLALLSV
jgi:hypothetical protein